MFRAFLFAPLLLSAAADAQWSLKPHVGLAGLAPGMYLLQLEDAGHQQHIRFVKR
jgi:hypothetical protein